MVFDLVSNSPSYLQNMSSQSTKLKIKPTSWLVRVKECHRIQRPESTTEIEDPKNGMILGDNDDIDYQ